MHREEKSGTTENSEKDYCRNCGQLNQVKRIDGTYILSELGSIFNFEKGILFTVKELLIRPGKNIRIFILKDRNRLTKPVLYVVVCSLFYTLLQSFLRFEDGYVNYSFQEGEASTTEFLFTWISSNYGYANLLMALFIALWLRLMFRKIRFNMFEILILLCFVMGTGMLIFSIIGVLDSLVSVQILDKGFFLGFVYTAWAIGQFFDRTKFLSYVKAFFAYMLGVFTFSLCVVVIGQTFDRLL
ncbi:MAG: DUF3667 domain-containing protein [Bacteroidetes bacterium]|nr:DUF3667 domain-containing protein [Bacteroidota bacterium]